MKEALILNIRSMINQELTELQKDKVCQLTNRNFFKEVARLSKKKHLVRFAKEGLKLIK